MGFVCPLSMIKGDGQICNPGCMLFDDDKCLLAEFLKSFNN